MARYAAASDYDCRRCGACCCNPSENRTAGYIDYVAIDPSDRIMGHPALMQRYSRADADGRPHLRLTDDGRCTALRGGIGRRVHCDIYDERPAPCRRVEAGSDACLYHRIDHGLAVHRVPTPRSTPRRSRRARS